MCYLEFCLDKIYGFGSPKTKEILDRVIKTLDDLYKHYKEKADKDMSRNKKGNASPSLVPEVSSPVPQVDMKDDFRRFLASRGSGVNKSEVEIYLGGEMEESNENFDILSWWKIHSQKFPILSQIARHILGMPISTVASESAFSIGGRVIDQFRSSLSAKTAEALICTQDWLRTSMIDIGGALQNIPVNDLVELQDQLEKIELDEFSTGESVADCSMDED